MKELIRDNGKIRNCRSNHLKMSYFQLIMYDMRYSFFKLMFENMIEIIINLAKYIYCFVLVFISIVFFPFALILRAYVTKKKAIKKDNEFNPKKNKR